MTSILGEKRVLSRSAMLLVPFRKGYLRLLEGYGDRQTHPHFGGGSSQDWGEESAGVLQRPGTQICEDQLDNA